MRHQAAANRCPILDVKVRVCKNGSELDDLIESFV